MNQPQQYIDSQQSHMSGGTSYTPQPPTTGISHYTQYQHQQPALQPGPTAYAPSPSYNQYAYANNVTSPQPVVHPVSAPQMGGQMLPLPAMTGPPQHSYVPAPGGPAQTYAQQTFDTTGQIAPTGMKPRVTATLWEDEGSLCFQVEAKGVCVARREDNHMINGTKLLNVAGMTRGRRDGILKSEKTRHVVKIGPMHLKGVWIPFERALDFANREKITELLYPLFVHNIGALLYHPTNSTRTNMVMQAAERRKLQERAQQQQNVVIGPAGSQPPALHHHHSMSSGIGGHVGQQQHSIAPYPPNSRPSLDRAHTFPTPPTSASSTVGMGGNPGMSDWPSQSMAQTTQPLSIDTTLSNARSMPNTPATTPPGPGGLMQNNMSYPSQSYDTPRSMYSSAPPQQNQYPSQQQNVIQQNSMRFGMPTQGNAYMKNEMGPPTSRTTGSGPDNDHGDHKTDPYAHSQGNEQVGHGAGEEEAEHEHDAEYANNAPAYSANHGPSYYNSSASVGPLQHREHPHLSPEQMSESPSHVNGASQGTPRSASMSQPQWTAGYQTPPSARLPTQSNLYSVMSDSRGPSTNGTSDVYAPTSMQSAYAPTAVNGSASSIKRGRDDDELDSSRPMSRGDDIEALKRRKTGREGSISTPTSAGFDREGRAMSRTRNVIIQQPIRRR
ncbi:MAG: hypothetical protein MMC33_002708 [Icmadophila ericetorum]|nr:hypothetical protein [Icmadophila ericetorum]